ncbi:14833_t:CDS:2, partial [Acaulospora colombiana]
EEVKIESKRPEMRITEAGQMNFFAVLIRSDGDGTILPGVTRDSCLALARYHNLSHSDPSHACLPNIPSSRRVYPVERIITVEEIMRSNAENRVLEVFAAGTAAVVCPIGRIGYRGDDIVFPTYPSGFGPVMIGLYAVMNKQNLALVSSTSARTFWNCPLKDFVSQRKCLKMPQSDLSCVNPASFHHAGCTNGSSGSALAKEYAANGLRVFAASRKLESMSDLAGKDGVTLIQLDVTQVESIRKAKER